MKRYIEQLKKHVLAVLVMTMVLTSFVPVQVSAQGNRHPFAVELQNIIDNLPARHHFESAALVNLDLTSDELGLAVITYYFDYIHVYTVTLIFIYEDQIRTFQHPTPIWPGFGLTEYNMLAVSHWGTMIFYVANGAGQVMDLGRPGPDEFWLNGRDITPTEFYRIAQTFGAPTFGVGQWIPLPDQTAQILAMQVPTTNAINVTINNTPVNFTDQAPTIVDGRTLVPVRGVFEALGFGVSWNEQARQVTLSRASDTIVITVDSATFTTNGTRHTLDVPAQIIGGRTMLPIRAVLESVGYDLGWNEATRTVVISTN